MLLARWLHSACSFVGQRFYSRLDRQPVCGCSFRPRQNLQSCEFDPTPIASRCLSLAEPRSDPPNRPIRDISASFQRIGKRQHGIGSSCRINLASVDKMGSWVHRAIESPCFGPRNGQDRELGTLGQQQIRELGYSRGSLTGQANHHHEEMPVQKLSVSTVVLRTILPTKPSR